MAMTHPMQMLFAVTTVVFVFAASAPCGLRAVDAVAKGGGFAKKGIVQSDTSKFPGKKWFVDIYGGVARLAGRRICNNRIRYRNGMIGYLCETAHRMMSRNCLEVKRVVSLADKMRGKGIPFLFALAPDKMSADNSLFPAGWQGEGPNADASAVARLAAKEGAEVLGDR